MVARLEQVDPVIAGHGPLPVTEAPEPITEIGRSIWQKDGARVRGRSSPAYRLAPSGESRQRLGTSKVTPRLPRFPQSNTYSRLTRPALRIILRGGDPGFLSVVERNRR
jgi:hypothetical protein